MKSILSVTIITLNEESNIERCLKSVEELSDDVILVDSGSTDKTIEIASRFKNVRIFKRLWEGYGQQKNFAHQQAQKEWVLNIDADEAVSSTLKNELIQTLSSPTHTHYNGYSFPRLTEYLGRTIYHGGWYPNRLTRLSKKSKSKWSEPSIHETLLIEGPIGKLHGDLLHFPFQSIEDQVKTNLKYAKLGTYQLKQKNKQFKIIPLIYKPIGKFIETYIIKKGFLDGTQGFIISVNAAYSIFLKYAFLFQPKKNRDNQL